MSRCTHPKRKQKIKTDAANWPVVYCSRCGAVLRDANPEDVRHAKKAQS